MNAGISSVLNTKISHVFIVFSSNILKNCRGCLPRKGHCEHEAKCRKNTFYLFLNKRKEAFILNRSMDKWKAIAQKERKITSISYAVYN
jgi:hypothetical protein